MPFLYVILFWNIWVLSCWAVYAQQLLAQSTVQNHLYKYDSGKDSFSCFLQLSGDERDPQLLVDKNLSYLFGNL